jgi:hypothetical protein
MIDLILLIKEDYEILFYNFIVNSIIKKYIINFILYFKL